MRSPYHFRWLKNPLSQAADIGLVPVVVHLLRLHLCSFSGNRRRDLVAGQAAAGVAFGFL